MKEHSRILGIDDAPFTFTGEALKTPLVGVLMRGTDYVESIMVSEITVDGADATGAIQAMVASSRYAEQIAAIMVDGAAVGGFNVIDIVALAEETALPVITITRREPDFAAIEQALKGHFDDWRGRLALMKRGTLKPVKTGHNPVYMRHIGIGERDAEELVKTSVKMGAIPEPLRVAHLVATAIVKKESRGDA